MSDFLSAIFGAVFGDALSSTGSYAFICLAIMVIIVLIFLFLGLDFDFALLCSAPLPYAFYKAGYIEAWISGIMIVIVLGISIYMIWIKWSNRQ